MSLCDQGSADAPSRSWSRAGQGSMGDRGKSGPRPLSDSLHDQDKPERAPDTDGTLGAPLVNDVTGRRGREAKVQITDVILPARLQ